jgi:MFS family permease
MKFEVFPNKWQQELRNIFRSLQYRNYRLFFIGQSISLIGTWMQRIAMPWLVYDLSHSVFLLGVIGFASQIPTFLLAPFAGVLSDRWNKYQILINTQILSMIQALILTLLFFIGIIEVWHIVLLSVLFGLINAFDMPSRQSFVIEMVGKKEDLSNAIALNSSVFNVARLVGPSIAGFIIAISNEGFCFLINGLSYLVVIAALLKMDVNPRKIEKRTIPVLKELKEGFLYTFGFAPIKYVILLIALVGLMGMSYTVLIPVFAKEILRGDSTTFGFLVGASGIGALTGAIYLASRKSVLGLGRVIVWSTDIFGIGLILFSFSKFFLLSLVLMVAVGLGMMLQMASSNTILQTVTDDDKRGRVMSFYTMAFMGTAPFGSLLLGVLAKMLGSPVAIAIAGISCIIGSILFALKLPEIKSKIRPVYIKLGILDDKIKGN